MKRPLAIGVIFLLVGMAAGCSYLQKKDEPPPLPPIEETKPPLTMKSEYFKSYPWLELTKPKKDGNDPDTITYTAKDGDTLVTVAEKIMGDPGLAKGLADFNQLPSDSSLAPGDKVIIPYPIIGMSSRIKIKSKGDKEFGDPKPFPPLFTKGDEYKLRFESNVNGYCYVFRKETKGVAILYPAQVKKGKKGKTPQPLPLDSGKIKAHDPIEIPIGTKGTKYDPKKAGDTLMVFLSLKPISELERLREKTSIAVDEVEEVMHRVKEGEILNEPPYHLLRITDPAEIMGFSLNIDG